MTRTLLISATLLGLAACQSTEYLNEGQRINWRCAGDKEFSLRNVPGAIEVYASGQTHRLEPGSGAEGQYRSTDGAVTYVEDGDRATLTGVHNGPFENCQRRRSDWWFRFW